MSKMLAPVEKKTVKTPSPINNSLTHPLDVTEKSSTAINSGFGSPLSSSSDSSPASPASSSFCTTPSSLSSPTPAPAPILKAKSSTQLSQPHLEPQLQLSAVATANSSLNKAILHSPSYPITAAAAASSNSYLYLSPPAAKSPASPTASPTASTTEPSGGLQPLPASSSTAASPNPSFVSAESQGHSETASITTATTTTPKPPTASQALGSSVLDRGAKAIKASLFSATSVSKKATKKVSDKTFSLLRRHSTSSITDEEGKTLPGPSISSSSPSYTLRKWTSINKTASAASSASSAVPSSATPTPPTNKPSPSTPPPTSSHSSSSGTSTLVLKMSPNKNVYPQAGPGQHPPPEANQNVGNKSSGHQTSLPGSNQAGFQVTQAGQPSSISAIPPVPYTTSLGTGYVSPYLNPPQQQYPEPSFGPGGGSQPQNNHLTYNTPYYKNFPPPIQMQDPLQPLPQQQTLAQQNLVQQQKQHQQELLQQHKQYLIQKQKQQQLVYQQKQQQLQKIEQQLMAQQQLAQKFAHLAPQQPLEQQGDLITWGPAFDGPFFNPPPAPYSPLNLGPHPEGPTYTPGPSQLPPAQPLAPLGTSQNPIVLGDSPSNMPANPSLEEALLPIAPPPMPVPKYDSDNNDSNTYSDEDFEIIETEFEAGGDSDSDPADVYEEEFPADVFITADGEPGYPYLDLAPASIESFEAIRKKARLVRGTEIPPPQFLPGKKRDSDVPVVPATEELFHALEASGMGPGEQDIMRLSHHVFSLACVNCNQRIFPTACQVYDWVQLMMRQRVITSFVQCLNPDCLNSHHTQCVGCGRIEKLENAPRASRFGIDLSYCCVQGRVVLLWTFLWGMNPFGNGDDERLRKRDKFTHQEINYMLSLLSDELTKQEGLEAEAQRTVHILQERYYRRSQDKPGLPNPAATTSTAAELRSTRAKLSTYRKRVERFNQLQTAVADLRRDPTGATTKLPPKKGFSSASLVPGSSHSPWGMASEPNELLFEKAIAAANSLVYNESFPPGDALPVSGLGSSPLGAMDSSPSTENAAGGSSSGAKVGGASSSSGSKLGPSPSWAPESLHSLEKAASHGPHNKPSVPLPLGTKSSGPSSPGAKTGSFSSNITKNTLDSLKSVFKKHKSVQKSGVAKGTGYGGGHSYYDAIAGVFDQSLTSNVVKDFDYAMSVLSTPVGGGNFTQLRKKQDEKTATYLDMIKRLLPTDDSNDPFNKTPQPILPALIARSPLLDTISELLSCDSLVDIGDRSHIYHSLVSLLRTLSWYSEHWNLLLQGRCRLGHPDGKLLEFSLIRNATRVSKAMWDDDESTRLPPMVTLLEALAKRAGRFQEDAKKHNFESQGGIVDPLVSLCADICTVYTDINQIRSAVSDDMDVDLASPTRIAVGSLENVPGDGSASSLTADEKAKAFAEWHRENSVAEVEDEIISSVHHYAAKGEVEKAAQAPVGRMKRILTEIAAMRTSLPEGVFVRYASSRPDLMKILIIGPRDTPYEYGLFEFDLWCTSKYPQEPPKMKFKTTNNGRVRFNPNLYADGKICLSLLGTWEGQRWIPTTSTILQVLVSIQGMILCENPWYNEPGREMSRNESACSRYNQNIRKQTFLIAITPWLSKKSGEGPPSRHTVWADVVARFFETHGTVVYQSAEKWKRKSFSDTVGALKKMLEESRYL